MISTIKNDTRRGSRIPSPKPVREEKFYGQAKMDDVTSSITCHPRRPNHNNKDGDAQRMWSRRGLIARGVHLRSCGTDYIRLTLACYIFDTALNACG